MQAYQSLLTISKKYLNEKFVMWMLVQRYKVKFRTWRIMADEEQIGMVTTATRPVVHNGKVTTILLQFAFLSPIDKEKISKFEGHRCACLNLFTQKPKRLVVNPDNPPGSVKEEIKFHIMEEIKRRKSFWLRKVWDTASTFKVELI